mgnify:FL=1
MSRALRRHHLSRLKSKRRHDYCFAGVSIGQHVATPARCSCWMCGNPRRFYGNGHVALTVQQLRQTAAAQNEEAILQAA